MKLNSRAQCLYSTGADFYRMYNLAKLLSLAQSLSLLHGRCLVADTMTK